MEQTNNAAQNSEKLRTAGQMLELTSRQMAFEILNKPVAFAQDPEFERPNVIVDIDGRLYY